MKEMIKKLMVVLVSAFLLMGTVFTPVEAKGSNTSGTNGWRNPWGWFWGWGYPQPTQPEPEPEPTEEPVVEEEEPVVAEEPIVEEQPVVEEEPVVTEEPVIEEEPEAKAQECDAVSLTEGYSATISFEEDAQIADGATASIEEYAEDTEDFTAAKAAVLEAKGVDEDEIGFIAFDMTLYDAEGNEIEPAEGSLVNVALAVQLPQEALEADYIEIHHIKSETGEVETVATSYDEAFTIDGDTVNADLAVGGFSTFTITWRRTATVYYVDEGGNELNISNPANTHPNMTTSSASPAFLIYDIAGYEYSYTYRNTDNNRIRPLLERGHDNNNRWYYTTGTGDYPSWNELANNDKIYVVYKKKADPTTGGTPVIEDATSDDWPQDPATPQFSKTSINNGNGTNTVSLSITGGEKDYEKSTKANVIVVFDRSGSMSYDLNGQQRLKRAQTAVNTMAKALLDSEITGVKMALVSFSTTASTVQGFTDNYNTYTSAVNGLTAAGGTNWEQSLSIANRMAVDSDAATFIVFVTDGDPTFRVSRGDVTNGDLVSSRPSGSTQNRSDMYSDYTYYYYRNNYVFGDGNNDYFGRNFHYAAEEVKSILNNNKNFYAIGVSSDVTKVQNLVNEAGGGTAYLATDSTALEEAFANITKSIKTTLGFGDVQITDGITELANVEMKVMQEVDPKSFTYYKVTSAGQVEWDPASEGAGLAGYDEDTGAVTWDMGPNFQLENGVTYMVTFKVWPSQDAYNLVAQLNNGVKVYAPGQPNSITDEERAQVVELAAPTANSQGSYTLKTNTDNVNATYSQTSKSGETVTVSGDTDLTATYHEGTIQNMALESMLLTIKKEFEDDLTGGEDRETQVTLVLKYRSGHQAAQSDEAFVDYPAPHSDGTTGSNIVLNEGNNWTYSVYVPPGLMESETSEPLEKGYDFTITEPDIDYHYGLIEEIINPMVVGGEEMYYGDGYLIDDKDTINKYVDRSLTAVNRVKSGIDVRKTVVDDAGNEIASNEEFTIVGKILDPEGNPYTFDNAAYDQRSDKSSNTWVPANQSAHQNDPIAYHKYVEDPSAVPGQNGAISAYGKTYRRTVYKGHFDSTGAIEFTLKTNEMIRFINVPDECTFEFGEVTGEKMPENYEWLKSEGTTQHRTEVDGPYTTEGDIQPTVTEDGKVIIAKDEISTGVVGNKQYTVVFTNKSVKGECFYVYHSSNNTIEKIYADDARVTKGEYNEETKTYPYTFNIVNETNTGHLYGGYFKSYNGAGMSDEEIMNAEYTENETASAGVYSGSKTTGFWAADTNGSVYDGSVVYWKVKQAYTDTIEVTGGGKGTAITAKANTVYYLKEIPDQYFRPALHYIYDDRSENKDLKKLYLMVPTDDSVYNNVGAEGTIGIEPVKKLYTSYAVTDYNNNTVYYNANAANEKLTRGYITVWDANSKIAADTSYDWTPYLTTKDGVKVTSVIKRKIVMGNAGFEVGKSNKLYDEAQSDIIGFYVYDLKTSSTAN